MSDTPSVMPYLYYEDATGVLEFLCGAFGFEEVSVLRDDEGAVWSAQVEVGTGGRVLLGPGMTEFGTRGKQKGEFVTSRTHVTVADVDAHHAAAIAEGAVVDGKPREHFDARIYIATDPGGHQWVFAGAEPEANR